MEHNAFLMGLGSSQGGKIAAWRDRQLFIEFGSFLQTYLRGKRFAEEGETLDAYQEVIQALNHWARMVVIKAGLEPEDMLWKQVRKVNSGVYKLFEELTTSSETLEQRVQLVLLACEFSAMSQLQTCCMYVISILDERRTPWSIGEINEHPDLAGLPIDVGLVIRKLVKKGLVREVSVTEHWEEPMEVRYLV